MVSEKVLQIVLTIVLVLLTGVIVPWARAKWGNARFDGWVAKAKQIVASVEQQGAMFDWDSTERKDYALTALTSLGVPDNMASDLIEAAVAAMTTNGNELVKDPKAAGTISKQDANVVCKK
jgi:hypothetical protein